VKASGTLGFYYSEYILSINCLKINTNYIGTNYRRDSSHTKIFIEYTDKVLSDLNTADKYTISYSMT